MHMGVKFVEIQRAVVERAGQAEAVFHKVLLACAVAAVHAAHLRQCDVGFVHHQKKIVREIVEQRVGRRPGGATGQHAGIVLDALANADLPQHLDVVLRALLDALRLQQLAFAFEVFHSRRQLRLDVLDRPLHLVRRHNVVGGGIERDVGEHALYFAGERVHLRDAVDLVAEKLDAHHVLARIGGVDLHHVAAHTELVAHKIDVVALVLQIDQPGKQIVPPHLHAGAQRQHHLAIVGGVAE